MSDVKLVSVFLSGWWTRKEIQNVKMSQYNILMRFLLKLVCIDVYLIFFLILCVLVVLFTSFLFFL